MDFRLSATGVVFAERGMEASAVPNQSINQSINQLINQSINQSISQDAARTRQSKHNAVIK
jgi:hypothetical protein